MILSVNTYEDGYLNNDPGGREMGAMELFEHDLEELEYNPDFTLFGVYDMTQYADEELEAQGLTSEQITAMNTARYGDVIEVLQMPVDGQYYVFIGAR